MKKKLLQRIEMWCIKKLITSGQFSPLNINRRKKTIHLGFWGLKYDLADPVSRFFITALVVWCKYKPMQQDIKFIFIS